MNLTRRQFIGMFAASALLAGCGRRPAKDESVSGSLSAAVVPGDWYTWRFSRHWMNWASAPTGLRVPASVL